MPLQRRLTKNLFSASIQAVKLSLFSMSKEIVGEIEGCFHVGNECVRVVLGPVHVGEANCSCWRKREKFVVFVC